MAAGKKCKHLEPTLIILATDDICTWKTNIYMNTFSATLTSQMAKNHEINVLVILTNHDDRNFVTHRHYSEIQKALVSKRRTLLSWKFVNRYNLSTFYAWCGYKRWCLFLVLDFGTFTFARWPFQGFCGRRKKNLCKKNQHCFLLR